MSIVTIITRRMFNIIGERERPNLSCQPSYCTIEVKKAHRGPKAMRITVFEGLTSRDSCRMQLQGLSITVGEAWGCVCQLKCFGHQLLYGRMIRKSDRVFSTQK